jgi:hypothetical protein
MGEPPHGFSFDTYAGKVLLETTDDSMTPFGGIVAFAAFLKKAGFLQRLASTSPVQYTSNNGSPIHDIIASFMLTVLCDGSRFVHVERLRHDPTLAQVMGMESVVSDETLLRYLKVMPEREGRHWISETARPLWGALPGQFILDWDSTVITRFGQQEDAVVGYNPHKPGRPSHHPLLAAIAGTRLCAYYRWRPGNEHTAAEWIEAMEECLDWLGPNHVPYLNRGDKGFGNEAILSWHEAAEGRPHYLFKLRMTRNVERAIKKISMEEWQGEHTEGMLQVAETRIQLPSWSRARRVVVSRRVKKVLSARAANAFWEKVEYEYDAYVTDLPCEEANAWQVVELYRGRADMENVFDELKNHWGFKGFCSKHRVATEMAARLLLLTYNYWNLFLRLMEPSRHVEAFQGRRWFLLMAARLVESGRTLKVKVAVVGEWWRMVSDGFARVCAWLESTAPQLGFGDGRVPALGLPDG